MTITFQVMIELFSKGAIAAISIYKIWKERT